MGRRAKKAPVVTKKKVKLAKRFKCPFCATDDTVECDMDHKKGLGKLECRLCAAQYQMPIHHLTEPIDVFSEWLDDCEAAQRGEAPVATRKGNLKDDERNQSIDLGAEDSEDEDDDDV